MFSDEHIFLDLSLVTKYILFLLSKYIFFLKYLFSFGDFFFLAQESFSRSKKKILAKIQKQCKKKKEKTLATRKKMFCHYCQENVFWASGIISVGDGLCHRQTLFH